MIFFVSYEKSTFRTVNVVFTGVISLPSISIVGEASASFALSTQFSMVLVSPLKAPT